MQARQAIAAVAAVVSIGSLAACGDRSTSGGTAGTAASASATPASSTGHLDRTTLVPATTRAQLRAGSAHVSLRMTGALSLRGEGDVGYGSSDPRMQMTMTMAQLGSRKVGVRFVDGVLYLSIPTVTPPGKFLGIDPQDPGNPLTKSFGNLSERMDPMRALDGMQAAVRKVRYVGPATVDGARTDHYRITVDSATLFKGMKQKLPAGVPPRIDYDVWLDSSDLMRRLRVDVAGQRTETTMSRWGEPVDVEAPAPSKVVNAPGATS